MASTEAPIFNKRKYTIISASLVAVGAVAFFFCLAGDHPEKAWQAYLINFLLFSAIAQGGVLFSALMHTTRARWSGPLANLSESFAAFFPVSLVLFLILFLGKNHVFPWLHADLHGKEVWLNVPFLFSRDLIGLIVLYGLGFAYLFHALWFKLERGGRKGRIRSLITGLWKVSIPDAECCRNRMNVLAILYMLAFALILSLIGYDLVMAADPHWYSTLFGAYTFVKAVYVGLGSIIILAALLHMSPGIDFTLKPSQFHDIGKLFFAFCLVWADFFYCQLVIIWYGNIPEETAYVIERTLTAPWNRVAWFVFIVSFILPFIILLNKKIKTKPKAMTVLCITVIVGIWLEHFLLLGPALSHHAQTLPLSVFDALISLAFLGLMIFAVTGYLNRFPELVTPAAAEVKAEIEEVK